MKTKRKNKNWTESEDEKLKALVKEGFTNKEIAEKMNRPFYGICNRVSRIGELSRNKRFTAEEDQQLIEWLKAGKSFGYMARKTGRQPGTIKVRLDRIGAHEEVEATKEESEGNTLTAEDLEDIRYLESKYGSLSETPDSDEVLIKLRKRHKPKRKTPDAIKKTVSKPWTVKEKEFLEENHLNMDNEELGKRLKRSKQSIASQKARLGLASQKRRIYSEAEIEFIRESLTKMTREKLAEAMDRDVSSLRGKISKMRRKGQL